jgi:hypothetical protein
VEFRNGCPVCLCLFSGDACVVWKHYFCRCVLSFVFLIRSRFPMAWLIFTNEPINIYIIFQGDITFRFPKYDDDAHSLYYVIGVFDSLKLVWNRVTSQFTIINFSLSWFDFYDVCCMQRIVTWSALSSFTALILHARIIARWIGVTRSANQTVKRYSTAIAAARFVPFSRTSIDI